MLPRRRAGLLLCLSIFPMWAFGEVSPQAIPDAAPQLATVEVQGEMPGPGLWRVAKGEHVLWILGELSPLPEKMSWDSRDVEVIIAESQEVILMPKASLSGGRNSLISVPRPTVECIWAAPPLWRAKP